MRLECRPLGALIAVLLSAACNEPAGSGGMAGGAQLPGTGGSAEMQPTGGMLAAGVGGVGGAGGMVAMGGGAGGVGGTQAGTGGGGAIADAGAITDSGPAVMDTGVSDATQDDLMRYAGDLDGMFVDVPCVDSTPLPLAEGATCDHPPGTQHIERAITFGGDPSTTYAVTLRVRGIWEPTTIAGGEAPDDELPFKIGGTIAGGSAVDYQQYSIVVSAPAQTYWLNDHQYLAHDIHKLDYEATLRITGGATVSVIMNDGNERQIANWTEDFFAGLPPYDTEPSTGQSLQLDVLAVQGE